MLQCFGIVCIVYTYLSLVSPCTANTTASVSESASGTADVSARKLESLLHHFHLYHFNCIHTYYSFDQNFVCMSGSGKLSSPYKADVFTLCHYDCVYSIDQTTDKVSSLSYRLTSLLV